MVDVSNENTIRIRVSSANTESKIKVINSEAHYYSELAHEYANQAGSYATAAGTSATLASEYLGLVSAEAVAGVNTVNATKTQALSLISDATTAGVGSVTSATTAGLTSITDARTEAIDFINIRASESATWAEGSDEAVQLLGGTHSAKEWANYSSTVNNRDVHAINGDFINPVTVYTEGDSDSVNGVLADIKKQSHSSYNSSRFTLINSPSVTSNGIASGFTTSNYIRGTYTLDVSKSWEVTCSIITGATVAAEQNGIWSWATNFVLSLYNTNKILFENISSQNIVTSLPLDINSKYYIVTGWDLTNYYIKVYDDNYELYDSATLASSTAHGALTGTHFAIGVNGATDQSTVSNPFINGSIDLKGFSIKSEGVTVYSGSKTGIDVIKTDNYTVGGTPTITSDGIVSGFSSSNYINTGYNMPSSTANSWVINLAFTAPAVTTGGQGILGSDTAGFTDGLLFQYLSTGKLRLRVYRSGSSVASIETTDALSVGVKYYVQLVFTGNKYILRYKTLNTAFIDKEVATTSKTNSSKNIYLGLVATTSFNGSIDLNAVSVYVEGNLEYQACLKIPYVETVTGNRICDLVYRSRVTDMYNQFGYVPYYTLSNSDFTLANCKPYDIVASYENGINKWEKRADQTVIQQGACTSGTAVTLLKELRYDADNDYVLSVPYSAKSGTGFTPSQTGEWIAIGKGV